MDHDLWSRVEAALGTYAPCVLNSLRPAASEAQISAAEAALGVQLPAEVRAAYMRHDGSASTATWPLRFDGMLFPPFCSWASLAEMVEHHQGWVGSHDRLSRERDSEYLFPAYDPSWDMLKVRPVWYDPARIPIGVTNTTSTVFLDLAPAPAGVVGQLIKDHGMGEASWLADGLNDFLEGLIVRLESGRLIYREGWVWADINEMVHDWNRVA
jgi:cell wall assembly regulator SMI1